MIKKYVTTGEKWVMGRQKFFVLLLQLFVLVKMRLFHNAMLQKNKRILFPSREVSTGRDIRKAGVLDILYLDPGWGYMGAYIFKFP